jgi:uncharacterized membrane protein YqjE
MSREPSGILADVKGLAATALRAVHTRLELVALEVAEEKEWAVRFLAAAVTSLYLASFGLLLAVFAVAAWAPVDWRPIILGGCAFLFLAAGAAGLAGLCVAAKRRDPVLSDTIAVLKGDEKALREGLGPAGD